jgi:hypothetical protein
VDADAGYDADDDAPALLRDFSNLIHVGDVALDDDASAAHHFALEPLASPGSGVTDWLLLSLEDLAAAVPPSTTPPGAHRSYMLARASHQLF